ncbi:hypothetical protein ABE096_13910 [Robertmurraya massiliosenegalensis]|uniref:hypothetical protein n=1 Tax=Robertmurraya TaxID=2837507 RepID=UPI0039A607CC
MVFNLFRKKNKIPSSNNNLPDYLEDYNKAIRDIQNSKYCNISSDEEEFIYCLIKSLKSKGNNKTLNLRRMSNMAIDVTYDIYPIGKVKLQGSNTWMQIFLDLYDVKVLENCVLEEYLENIELWIQYIQEELSE